MNVIYKLINELLEADKLGKQRVATNKLVKGIEQYANQRVIDELERVMENLDSPSSRDKVSKRIEELKKE